MTEQELNSAIAKARAEYHEGAQTQPAPVLAALTDKIKAYGAQLVELLTAGADKCKVCGNMPHGMLRTPSYKRKVIRVAGVFIDGENIPPVYEVGCVTAAYSFEKDPTDAETEIIDVPAHAARGRGTTPSEAVKNWNERNTQR